MPQRVTKEERMVSLVIEKARDAKEILYQSMYDNNRSPVKDESEAVKVKRPKAEKADKISNETQKDSGYGLAGEVTEFKKAVLILKNILESDYEDNPIWNKEAVESAEKAVESATKELQMLLDKYKSSILITDDVKDVGGIPYVEATVVFKGQTTEALSVRAQAGINPNRKGMDIAQSFGSSSSYARKYALAGMFLLDDTKDADTQDNSKENFGL